MADFMFQVARGRLRYYYDAVDLSLVQGTAGPYKSTADAALVLMAINAGGVTDDTLRDFSDLAALLASAANEVTNTGYARKVLTDSDLGVSTPNNTLNTLPLDVPDQAWLAVAAGDAWTDLLWCFDPDSTSGIDSEIIPLTCHDFPKTPSGLDIVASISSFGIYGSRDP